MSKDPGLWTQADVGSDGVVALIVIARVPEDVVERPLVLAVLAFAKVSPRWQSPPPDCV